MGLRDLRRHRGLPRLLTAQAPADLADWLDFVALGGLLVFHWGVGPVALAWLAVALGLPYVLVGPFMGALVDRVPLRAALVASNLGRAAATAALMLPETVPALLAVVFLKGCSDSAFTPARQAAIQALAPPEARTMANGTSHAINQAAKVAGPALGGLLLTVLEPQSVFLVNAAVSALAAVILLTLPGDLRPPPEAGAEGGGAPWGQVGGALALVRARPPLRLAIGLMSAGFFALFFYDALIPLLTRALGHSERVFGAAIAAVGAGGVRGRGAPGRGRRGAALRAHGGGLPRVRCGGRGPGPRRHPRRGHPGAGLRGVVRRPGPLLGRHRGALPHGAAEPRAARGRGPRHRAGRGREHHGAPRRPLRGGRHRRRRGRGRGLRRRRVRGSSPSRWWPGSGAAAFGDEGRIVPRSTRL